MALLSTLNCPFVRISGVPHGLDGKRTRCVRKSTATEYESELEGVLLSDS
jgi:hypothetical protein